MRWLKFEEALEMKVTWKNKKKKPLSLFTELPFEHDTDQSNSHTTEHDSDGTPQRSPNSEQSTQLSMQFQAQGDNLAMVSLSSLL